MEKTFALELIDWLHELSLGDEERARKEENERDVATTVDQKTFRESRRIGFVWRADLARTIAAAVRLREVPQSGGWTRFRKRAGEELPNEIELASYRINPSPEKNTND